MVCFLQVLTMLLFSCKSNNQSTASESDLFYYPEKNVYYDSGQATYYYSLDSAKTWDSLQYKGIGQVAALGIKIPLTRAITVAWRQNDLHRKTYNGKVLNIINSHTIFLGRLDSINRMKPKVIIKYKPVDTVGVTQLPPPQKKGLGKFFNKIFGKKKKKE